jgi:23S rRNA (cytidine1920-2'-O)/16S rRNA (cytidine1409-2'-O)-methyltransferase
MRADQYLVQKGHYPSRARAQAAIKAGLVQVNDRVLKKASATIPSGAQIAAEQPHPYVSRGGLKLAHAIEVFALDASGRICLDVGSSTGGFTDVLCRAGAAKVYAIDVGRDQLDPSLRSDPRIVSMEGQDARSIHAAMFDPSPDLLVCDASFISITKLLGPAMALCEEAVLLFKPQFEVGRENIGKGGIVRGGVEAAQDRVKRWISDQGWRVVETTDSPIAGGSGNREYLWHVRRQGSSL